MTAMARWPALHMKWKAGALSALNNACFHSMPALSQHGDVPLAPWLPLHVARLCQAK
jgi:hypothetical protein